MGVISILSAIVVPNFNRVREEAFISTMKGDLHQLRFAQEVYNVEPNGEYATSIADLSEMWSASEGVSVTMTGDGETWQADATHPGTSVTCSYDLADNQVVCGEADPSKK